MASPIPTEEPTADIPHYLPIWPDAETGIWVVGELTTVRADAERRIGRMRLGRVVELELPSYREG